MTDFVDFVISSGTPKLTTVRNVKNRPKYDPKTDYWKRLREGIAAFHEGGGGSIGQLDQIVQKTSDDKKLARYPECVAGYKKFLGKKKCAWSAPPTGDWGPAGIGIRVNPELGLNLNGTAHVIKLYFKAEPLSKRRVQTILILMQLALAGKVAKGTSFGVLDVPRAKLYADPSPDPSLIPLLTGEATSFLTIWNSV